MSGASGESAGDRIAVERQIIWIAGVVGVALLAIGILAVVANLRDVSFGTLVRDPIAVGSLDLAAGLASRLGVISWTLAAGIGIGSGWVGLRAGNDVGEVALGFGVFSLLLGIDDSLMLHEAIGDKVGFPLVEACYGVVLALLLFRLWRPIVARTPWLVLLSGALLLGASVGVDVLDDYLGLQQEEPIEDSLKLVGILVFGSYLAFLGWAIAKNPHGAGEPAPERGIRSH